ncbi:uncharacterized protein LOC131229536 isoform X2 [Magnolia sinica]|uniref:uncharacterized protein LOC131229536 isoform X2 n=1 Tax=Magnolia sinica TaxID=86752 RepID=UPI0026586F87|nr:uncharacterized protein LOC131229536 isoform X2 [Magnolia sinica]
MARVGEPPKLLTINSQKDWPLVQRLLVDLFKFMEPYLRNAELGESVHFLYKGTLRVLLVLLHDFPEFLCDYHFSFCDVIPPSCIQMRNVILSAFPRNMRLPDPSTPNLKIDLLAEISQSPRILSEVDGALKAKQIKADIDEYLKEIVPLRKICCRPETDYRLQRLHASKDSASMGQRNMMKDPSLVFNCCFFIGSEITIEFNDCSKQVLEMESMLLNPDFCRDDLAGLLKAVQAQEKQKLHLDLNQLCLNLGLQALQPFDATHARVDHIEDLLFLL